MEGFQHKQHYHSLQNNMIFLCMYSTPQKWCIIEISSCCHWAEKLKETTKGEFETKADASRVPPWSSQTNMIMSEIEHVVVNGITDRPQSKRWFRMLNKLGELISTLLSNLLFFVNTVLFCHFYDFWRLSFLLFLALLSLKSFLLLLISVIPVIAVNIVIPVISFFFVTSVAFITFYHL